jgi:drug/metabolite transporter (DMT)-like permease
MGIRLFMSPAASRVLLLAAAVLFSTGGAAIKACSLSPWQIAGFRSGVAAIVIAVFSPQARRGWTWHVLPIGACYASVLILFVRATKLTTAANAIFLQSTAPLYLLLLGPWLLAERLRLRDVMFASAVAAGMVLMFLRPEAVAPTAPDPVQGNIFGALSGLAWALALTGLRWLGKGSDGPPLPAVVVGNAIAFIVCMPAALPVSATQIDLAVILYLGTVQIGLAYACLTRGLRQVPAFEASALLLLEPALNPIWAWLLHAERPGGLALAGGVVILAAILFHTIAARDR